MHIQPVILHAQNTFNNGSFMMLINLVWYYVKHAPEGTRITFWVELDGAENAERFRRAFPTGFLSGEVVEIRQLPLKITSVDHSSFLRKSVRLLGKFYGHPRTFKKLGIDSIILLGGDDISEYYKKWMILSDLYRIRRYSKKFPTILAGQTIGPFKGLRERVAASCLSGTRIYTRDEPTVAYLKSRLRLDGKQVRSSADLCFPDLPLQKQDTGFLTSLGLEPDQYLALVPGGFYTLYTRDRQAYINAWTRLVKGLLDNPAYERKQVVLLPHVTRPEDDREMTGAIYRNFPGSGENPKRLRRIDEELMPHQLRLILGNGHLTISSRMHAALSTFQMGKPAIALGYSVKYEGVIGTSLELPELILSCSADLINDPEHFAFEVLNKTGYLEANYQLLTDRLKKRVPRLKTMAEDQIREICLAATAKG